MIPFLDVPIIINSFNRLESLRRLVTWLKSAYYKNIIVVDNASTYQPLLGYLEVLKNDGIRVLQLEKNCGHKALWEQNLLAVLGIDTEYVYTDPDVVPCDFCPHDVVAMLQNTLASEPAISKAGLGLRIDDLPDSYKFRTAVQQWERQFWLRPAARGLFFAQIDTTFALRRPHGPHGLDLPSVRSGWPYLAAHEGWYIDSEHPSEEDMFYLHTAMKNVTSWSAMELPGWLEQAARLFDANQPFLLHLGGGRDVLPGYVNVDRDAEADVQFDLDRCGEKKLPFSEGTVDGIYGSDLLGRIGNPLPLMEELYRVAKHNARMTVRLPYGSSNEAYEDPRNVRAYFENSFAYFGQPAHYRNSPDYHGDWAVERVVLTVGPHLRSVPETDLREMIKFGRNVVTDMLVHLRAVKPARPTRADLLERPRPEISFSRLDPYSGFAHV